MRKCLFIILLFIGSLQATAQNAIPTQKADCDTSTWANANIVFSSASDGRYIQEGRGHHKTAFIAEAFSHNGTNTLWGKASYENSFRRKVIWNETSDIQYLYPYITADSVGGNIRCESYKFKGGYAHRFNEFAAGATLSYRASNEYRTIDPRPQNIASKLLFCVAASYGTTHIADLAVEIGKYKQDNSIIFKSEKGVPQTYHLNGLTRHYGRFAGNNNKTFYDGYELAISTGYHNRLENMTYVTITYRHRSTEVILNKDNDVPISRIDENTLLVSANKHQNEWFYNLSAKYNKRKGTEMIYGEVTGGNAYKKIIENTQYHMKQAEVDIKASFNDANRPFGADINGGYSLHDEEYLLPNDRISVSRIGFNGAFNAKRGLRKSALSLHVGAGISAALTNSISTTNTNNTHQKLVELTEANYESLRTPEQDACLGGKIRVEMTDKVALIIKANYTFTHLSRLERNINAINFGLSAEF